MDEYQRRIDHWIHLRFQTDVDPGTGRLATDCAAYESGGWAEIQAQWQIYGSKREKSVLDEAWKEDFSWLIRELIELQISPETCNCGGTFQCYGEAHPDSGRSGPVDACSRCGEMW